MRIHLGRAATTAIVLAEAGAFFGTAVAWLYLIGRTFLWEGVRDAQGLLGVGLWALGVGLPVGAITAPVLGLTVLRRVPLRRVLAFPAAGALLGLAAGALFHRGPALPIPVPTILLLALGVLLGVVLARRHVAGAAKFSSKINTDVG